MGNRRNAASVPDLVTLKSRFARRRSRRPKGSRIPDALWDSAAELAGRLGVSRTALALRLDFYALRRRMRQADPSESAQAVNAESRSDRPQFVELPAITSASRLDCTLEIKGKGELRIEVKNISPVDLESLVKTVLNGSA